jgi:glycosyltransferase involved in cell wall biosynthesis
MSNKLNRIGVVMPLARQQGGAELLLMHLLQHESERFEILCVFLENGPMVEQARSLGYRTFVKPITRVSDAGNFLSTALWFRKWLRKEKPDAVLSWMPKAHLYVAPSSLFSGVKLLWFQHGITNGSLMDRITTMLPTDNILCCSGVAKAAQIRVPPRRLTSVCHPGVSFPADPIPMKEARAKLGLDLASKIVGMVARLERWKGPHVFIEAARLVHAAFPETCFFIVGGAHPRDPAYAEEIHQQAARSGLGNRLILAGQRPSDEIPLWQASADLIIHPNTGTEPFGMVVAEAMGAGKVVIASRSGGPEEIIEDGLSGFLVPKGDAEALAATTMRLLTNAEERCSVEKRAFVRGRSFSIMQFAQHMEELIANTLQAAHYPRSEEGDLST